MTDKPTDEALENLFVEETGFDIDDFPAAIFGFALAVLAKWGQPAQAAEPVAWLDPWTGTKVTTDYDAYGKHGIPLVRQQPVEREPLSDDEVDSLCKVGPVYAPDGKVTLTPSQYRYALESAQRYGLRKGERAHGIKKRDPHVE